MGEPQRNGFFSAASSPAQVSGSFAGNAGTDRGRALLIMKESTDTRMATVQPQPGPSPWPGHLHSPDDDAQQTSHDLGARASQLHHAAGSQSTNDFLGFAVLTVQTRVRRATYSFAERPSVPHMGGVGRDRAGYVVSFPQRAAAHSLHRSA